MTTTPGTDLVFATASLKDRMDWSRAISGAGALVPAGFRDGNNPNPAKVLLAVEYGAMLGLHPMAALSGIHVIDGKPTLSAALMSSLVHKAGHRLRVTTSGTVTGTGTNLGGDFRVEVTLVRKDDPQHPFVAIWTIDRAKRAGLWGRGNWIKYPETQMTWRGVSEAAKLGAPEVLSGVWHTPDELGMDYDGDGDILDAEMVEQDQDGPGVVATMQETRSQRQTTLAPEDTQAIADEWAERAANTTTVEAARDLFNEARTRGLSGYTTSTDEILRDVIAARGKQLKAEAEQAAEESPLLSGPVALDDDIEAPY